MIDLTKYSKHIVLVLISLGILLNTYLTYKNIVLNNSFRFSALLDDRYITDSNGVQLEDEVFKEIIENHFFQQHHFLVDLLVEFVSLSGTNIAFVLFLILKIAFLYLLIKYLTKSLKDNKIIINAIFILFVTSAFNIATVNYLLDIISFIFLAFILIRKYKQFQVSEHSLSLSVISASQSNSTSLIDKSISNGIIIGNLLFIFNYLNPINLIFTPFFVFNSNKLNLKYTLSFLSSFILINIIIFFTTDYNILSALKFITLTNQFKIVNIFLLKNYLGLLIFILLFYYLIYFKKWKSGVVGLINFEVSYGLFLFFALLFLGNYYLTMYVFTVLLILILPHIANVITYYKLSDAENNAAITNFYIAYFLINLYLISNFY